MEFRLSRDEEYEQVRRLWAQAFGEEEPWTFWYFARHFRPDKTWVGVENGKVLAQAHLLPHRLRVRGSWREAVYFVGVCVEEELRGTGIGRELQASALAELKRSGVGISILQPRWPDFYRKLGWDYCYSRQRYDMPLAGARRLLAQVPARTEWTPDGQAVETLAALYEKFVQPRHGYAARERKDWDILLADHRGDGGRVGILSHSGVPAGYAMYNTLGDVLRVREMVWSEPWMVDAAWKHLTAPDRTNGVETIEWDDPSGDKVSILFSGSRSEPFLMGRMTDIQSVLTAMEYPAGLSLEMDLSVQDSLAPWNHGSFRWNIRQGKGALRPIPTGEAPGLRLGIGRLSQLLFGERPVREILAAENGNSYSEEELNILEQIFPVCHNFISEYF